MTELSREQLERMVDVLGSVLLECIDSETAEFLLRANGLDNEELAAIGFETDGEWAEMDACMEV